MTSGVIQKLAQVALSDQRFLKKTVKKTVQLRQSLFKEIRRIDSLYLGADSKTNVFLLKHKNKDLYQELLKRNIKTADFRHCLGIKGRGYVRITIANRVSNKVLLKTLKQI